MPKAASVIRKSEARRTASQKRPYRPPAPLPQDLRDRVLELLRDGATMAEICTTRELTSYGRVYHTRTVDPQFDADVRAAQAIGAEAALAEAQELSRLAADSGNPDLMRVAESFSRVTTLYAEKIAPREFGQLVKLGNSDGSLLSMQVINFALPAAIPLTAQTVGKDGELADTPRARAITASFDELDPDQNG